MTYYFFPKQKINTHFSFLSCLLIELGKIVFGQDYEMGLTASSREDSKAIAIYKPSFATKALKGPNVCLTTFT